LRSSSTEIIAYGKSRYNGIAPFQTPQPFRNSSMETSPRNEVNGFGGNRLTVQPNHQLRGSGVASLSSEGGATTGTKAMRTNLEYVIPCFAPSTILRHIWPTVRFYSAIRVLIVPNRPPTWFQPLLVMALTPARSMLTLIVNTECLLRIASLKPLSLNNPGLCTHT
jgi:hypothetical protein